MRYLKPLLLLLLCFVGFWSCEKRIPRANNSIDYIPANSETVIKIAHLETTVTDFAGSEFFQQLKDPLLYNFLIEQRDFISKVETDTESIICFQKVTDSLRHFTFITHASPSVFVLDSTYTELSQSTPYKKYQITESTFENRANYSTQVDSMFVASSSIDIIKEIIDNKTEQNPNFRKAYALNTKEGLVNLFRPTQLELNDSLTINFASQAAMELLVFPDGITASGVVLDRDTLPQLLNVFRSIQPQPNRAAYVTPVSAKQIKAITYDDAQVLEQNLSKYSRDTIVLDPIFGTINEVVNIRLSKGGAVALKSIDPSITDPEFKRFTSEAGEFRDITIYSIPEDITLFDGLKPFVDTMNLQYAFQWEEFFVFTESEENAQQLITDYTNGTTLVKTNYFENTAVELGESSSFLIYNLHGEIDPWMAPFLNAKNSSLKKFPLTAMQLSYDRDFAHINLVCKEVSQKQESTGLVTQLFAHQLDAAILGDPQFFYNHRTRGMDVVVQDIQNQVYLLSASGKRLWKKKLDGPILGSIQEVDLLRNGKKQLAFTTPNTFYILDRNGQAVAPFPKKFKDDITQPLSVFDYDNNRKYRFLVTQSNLVHMYDRDAKNVTGFTFKKTTSTIVIPPQHIRMGNKDYLLIAEENGKLNILSRVGKERVKVTKTFDFSNSAVMREGQNFVVIDSEKNKHSISQTGKVSSEKLKVSDTYRFIVRGNTKVTLDDNLLRINGKLVELPFGIYGTPSIHVSNRKTYVLVTDIQEKKVYAINKSGNILQGFPIYGSGAADIGDAKNNDKNAIVVKGNDNEVLLYSLD